MDFAPLTKVVPFQNGTSGGVLITGVNRSNCILINNVASNFNSLTPLISCDYVASIGDIYCT